MKTREIISKLEEVVTTLRNENVEENPVQEDEWESSRRTRFYTSKKDRYIVRHGYGDNKTYFTCYEEARQWIDKDMAEYSRILGELSRESSIPEYAIDVEETYTIEFVKPRKKKAVKSGYFGQQRAPDGEYKGVTDVWVE